MNKEFVPHKQSIELKELGFDEPCFGYYFGEYDDEYDECVFLEVHNLKSQSYIEKRENNGVLAPTYSQAFRWFREKYGLRNSITDFIDDETGIEWDYEIAIIGTDVDEKGNYKPIVDYSTDDETRKFKTYEEAELSCLRKLIEICTKK